MCFKDDIKGIEADFNAEFAKLKHDFAKRYQAFAEQRRELTERNADASGSEGGALLEERSNKHSAQELKMKPHDGAFGTFEVRDLKEERGADADADADADAVVEEPRKIVVRRHFVDPEGMVRFRDVSV